MRLCAACEALFELPPCSHSAADGATGALVAEDRALAGDGPVSRWGARLGYLDGCIITTRPPLPRSLLTRSLSHRGAQQRHGR